MADTERTIGMSTKVMIAVMGIQTAILFAAIPFSFVLRGEMARMNTRLAVLEVSITRAEDFYKLLERVVRLEVAAAAIQAFRLLRAGAGTMPAPQHGRPIKAQSSDSSVVCPVGKSHP